MPLTQKNKRHAWLLIAAVLVCLTAIGLYLKDDIARWYYFRELDRDLKANNHNRTANPWNWKAVDSGRAMLQTGDLVLRTGADVTSHMLCQMNQQDKTYSHCGIVMIEDGYPFVYHSIGGEDNPDERLRRDSASFFFSPEHNNGFGIARYDMSSANIARLSQLVQQYYKERKKFDMDFDLRTDDKLYCAEFVYKAVDRAMLDTTYIRPVTLFGFTFVAVDNLFKNGHAKLICQIKYK